MSTLPKQERGMVLVVSLILLLILTILAITAASTSTLQQRMANNAQEQNTSFQAAESGLSRWLILFEAQQPIPTGEQPAGANATFDLAVDIRSNCVPGSMSVGTGFYYDCYHITSDASTDTGARSRHQMGYLNRVGQ